MGQMAHVINDDDGFRKFANVVLTMLGPIIVDITFTG